MKSSWITMILVGFSTTPGIWMLFVPAAKIQHVQFGSTVTLGCDISYIYETTWFKHNPHLTPTVVLCASFREGRPHQGFQLSSNFSVELINRSLALKISGVEEGDLGLYYCIGNVRARLKVGNGTMLQVSSPGSSQFVFHHWNCVVVGTGLLIMVLVICITHWMTMSNKRTTK